ncbi:hypothetical protein [Paraferrimonas sedimenticola]|uniref:MSHA biogenesis protein MshF n=1 Tax=Paraferrimonas sedimenticola TaxID=375674 RepID=A0AA37RZG3_9GAMM|nr:hypothetical protein [Paraferrimonas sedimenticola]GLP97387.1 MSHA biogenesis protein MshF [Paraferrimonas sedimenticola]
MRRQQQAETDLLRSGRVVIALVVMMIILAVFGGRYLEVESRIDRDDFSRKQNTWIRMDSMLRSMWLTQGRPERVSVTLWGDDNPTWVRMSENGWPVPDIRSAEGCIKLWQQILGEESAQDFGKGKLSAHYDKADMACRFVSVQGDSLSYQLSSGRLLTISQANNNSI